MAGTQACEGWLISAEPAFAPIGLDINSAEKRAELTDMVGQVPQVVEMSFRSGATDPRESRGALECPIRFLFDRGVHQCAAVLQIRKHLLACQSCRELIIENLPQALWSNGCRWRGPIVAASRGVEICPAQRVERDHPEWSGAYQFVPLIIRALGDAGAQHGQSGIELANHGLVEGFQFHGRDRTARGAGGFTRVLCESSRDLEWHEPRASDEDLEGLEGCGAEATVGNVLGKNLHDLAIAQIFAIRPFGRKRLVHVRNHE